MRTNTYYLLAVLLHIRVLGFGQAGDGSNFNSYYTDPYHSSNIIPQTPNASNFTIYGNTPVNTSTGLPTISIPIYTIEEDGVEVPITLSYHASGIKVDDLSSTVGLKWTLSAGGGVFRTVKDFCDLGGGGGQGWIGGSGQSQSWFEDWLDANPSFNYYNKGNQQSFITNVIDLYDNWPDEFNYRFLNYSGDFIFRPDGSILKARQEDNLSIISNSINGFTLKDPLGNIFDFSDSEINLKNTIYYTETIPDLNIESEENVVGWMLSSIFTKNNKSIQFEYESYNFDYQLNYTSQRMVSAKYCGTDLSFCSFPLGCEGDGSPSLYNDMLKSTTTLNQTTNQLIRKIFTDNVEVEFIYTDGPVNGTTISGWTKRVDKIIIKDKIQNKSKEYLFTYGYFNSVDSNQKRLKLIGLQEKGFDGSLKPPYEFSYNNTPLPKMSSRAKDYKGFYNGKNNNPTLIARTAFSLDRTYLYGDPGSGGFSIHHGYDKLSDRYFNEYYLKAGILEEIKYPTGGKTQFIHEANALGINLNEPIIQAVGATISTGFDYSQGSGLYEHLFSTLVSVDNFVGKIEFTPTAACPSCGGEPNIDVPRVAMYKWNGNLSDSPSNPNLKGDELFGSSIEGGGYSPNAPNPPLDDGIYLIQLQVPDISYDPNVLISVDLNWFKKQVDQNGDVVYQKNYFGGLRIAEIKDIDVNNSVYNHKKYSYHDGIAGEVFYSNWNYKELGGQKIFSSDRIYEHGGLPKNGYTYTEVTIENQGQTNNGKTKEYYTGNGSFGHIIGGNLLRSEVYDESDNLLKVNAYEYESFYDDYYVFKIPSLIDEEVYSEQITCYVHPVSGDEIQGIKPIAGYNNLIGNVNYLGGWQMLSGHKTTDFLDIGASSSSVTTIKQYDHNNDLLVTYEKTDTRYKGTMQAGEMDYVLNDPSGEIIEIDYTYPKDHPSDMGTLINKGIYALPATREVRNSGNKIAGQAFEYDTSGNIKQVFHYNKGGGSNNSSLSYIPSNYEKRKEYVFENGLMVQDRTIGGPAVAYLWGYNDRYPVAKIENATYSQATSVSGLNMAVIDDPSSDQALRNEIDKIRQALSNALVTAYTYKPLVGVTSITDPKGDRVTYHYDAFGRLEYVKDKDGNILEEHGYHYRD